MNRAGLLLAAFLGLIPQPVAAWTEARPAPHPLASVTGQRPEDLLTDSFIDTAHFRVHYATSGPNQIEGWPDTSYRDSLRSYLERSYRCYRDTLNLPAPMADGDRGGGRDLLDAYAISLSSNELGLAPQDSCQSGGACSYTCAAYLKIVNTLSDLSLLRDIAAHELFHVFQFGLSAGQGAWLMESTAVWSERRVWPSDWTHVERTAAWFSTPYYHLWDETGDRDYGSAHFWLFLEQSDHVSFVPDLWRRTCAQDWRTALPALLAGRGETLDQKLFQFALWNNFTGSRDDGRHYEQGARYPEIGCQAEYGAYPVVEDSLPRNRLAGAAGSNYIRFDRAGGDTLHILFDGHYSLQSERRVIFVATTASDSCVVSALAPDGNGDVSFTLPGWSQFSYLTMIVSNGMAAAGHLGYRYSAWEGGRAPVPPLELRSAPNPFVYTTTFRAVSQTPRGMATVRVFDAGGREVRRFSLGSIRADDLAVVWNGADNSGRLLPSGVYPVLLQYGGQSVRGRVVLLH